MQIRLAREASQVQSGYATVEIYSSWRTHLIENKVLAEIVEKANYGETLTQSEDIRISTLMDDLFVTTAMSHQSGVKSNAFYDASGEVKYIERIFQ